MRMSNWPDVVRPESRGRTDRTLTRATFRGETGEIAPSPAHRKQWTNRGSCGLHFTDFTRQSTEYPKSLTRMRFVISKIEALFQRRSPHSNILTQRLAGS